jgi:hypothetical protein
MTALTEAVSSSERSVSIHHSTRRNISEEINSL